MIPVSYRASPVFYVQSARFIVYDTMQDVVALLKPERKADLLAKVASLHGFGGADPTEDEIRRAAGAAWQGSAVGRATRRCAIGRTGSGALATPRLPTFSPIRPEAFGTAGFRPASLSGRRRRARLIARSRRPD